LSGPGLLIGAPALSWLAPFPCFPQPLFRSLQLPLSPLDGFVFGMTLEPGVHYFPHGPDLLWCLGCIDAKHDCAPIVYQVHVRKHTEFAGSEGGRMSRSARALAAGPISLCDQLRAKYSRSRGVYEPVLTLARVLRTRCAMVFVLTHTERRPSLNAPSPLASSSS